MAPRPKLNQVADLANVSPATVSRVLNGRQGVAAATRQRVLDVLADLGYTQVLMRPTTSGVVGIVTPEMDNPIFPRLAQTIETRLAAKGMLSMICPVTTETVNEQEYLEHFLTTGAAGVIVINGRHSRIDVGYRPYEELTDRGISTVLVNGVEASTPVPAVTVDIERGGEMAVRHLISLGHRRIGCLVGPGRYVTTRQFLDGYCSGLANESIETDDRLVSESLFTIEGGRAGVTQLLEAGATGLVTAGDLMALGAIAGVRSQGYSVPEDVSVVGFDGTNLVNYTDPSLTSVRQPVERMSQTVVSLLLAPNNGGPKLHIFEPDLVIGGSTGPASS